MQRRILEQLKANTADPLDDHHTNDYASWTTVLELAGENATRAQVESTRRAVLKLAAAGLVDRLWIDRMVTSAHYDWPVRRGFLAARLPR